MSAPIHIQAIDKVEQVFDSVGLMRGATAPLLRFGVGFLVGGLLVYAARPEFAFDVGGVARPWALVASPDSKSATVVPWWSVGLALGAAFSILI